jgi:hypothetical protein
MSCEVCLGASNCPVCEGITEEEQKQLDIEKADWLIDSIDIWK